MLKNLPLACMVCVQFKVINISPVCKIYVFLVLKDIPTIPKDIFNILSNTYAKKPTPFTLTKKTAFLLCNSQVLGES
jgi:hypothetical protein